MLNIYKNSNFGFIEQCVKAKGMRKYLYNELVDLSVAFATLHLGCKCCKTFLNNKQFLYLQGSWSE